MWTFLLHMILWNWEISKCNGGVHVLKWDLHEFPDTQLVPPWHSFANMCEHPNPTAHSPFESETAGDPKTTGVSPSHLSAALFVRGFCKGSHFSLNQRGLKQAVKECIRAAHWLICKQRVRLREHHWGESSSEFNMTAFTLSGPSGCFLNLLMVNEWIHASPVFSFSCCCVALACLSSL